MFANFIIDIAYTLLDPPDQVRTMMDILGKPAVAAMHVRGWHRSPTWRFVRRFAPNKAAAGSAVIVLLLAVMAVFAPQIAPYDYEGGQLHGHNRCAIEERLPYWEPMRSIVTYCHA
ncbi:MAG: hypothetical protein IPK19_10415 [Chloroflexi bacterium]|nr:hypothetical protein [Chloroflexota bacterium]